MTTIMNTTGVDPTPTGHHQLRRLVLAVFTLGSAGTAAELLLLGHYEDIWQWLPLVVLALGLAAAAWLGWRHSPPARTRICRFVMALYLVSGVAGLYQHLTGNMEFERELQPALAGWPLVWESLRGATPALAPGALLSLGLLGLIATSSAWSPPAVLETTNPHGDL